jgi:hypothetical protein
MQKMLTTVQFEISTTIRFKPNDSGSDADGSSSKLPKPEVKADVQVRRGSRATERSDVSGAFGNDERPRERRRSRE